MVRVCDVVTINAPLHPETENLFDDALIAKMKRGAYLVNTARGKICDRDAVVRALESGQLAGYAGDVWFPQPAPADHPWRTMPHHGMTPHISGSSLSAQARYAAGTREILECWFESRPIREEYLIVEGGSSPAPARTPTARARTHSRFEAPPSFARRLHRVFCGRRPRKGHCAPCPLGLLIVLKRPGNQPCALGHSCIFGKPGCDAHAPFSSERYNLTK